MAQMTTERDHEFKPHCPCCESAGMHGYRPLVSPSPGDDSEGCTNCSETGRTWFTDAKPNSCQGYRTLMRRVNRG